MPLPNPLINEKVAISKVALSAVAKVILDQMGGLHKLAMMLGIGSGPDYQVYDIPQGVGFSWPNKQQAKGNCVEVKLDGDDTYSVTFFNVGGGNKKKVREINDVYADGLVGLFEEQTGWRIRLGGLLGLVQKVANRFNENGLSFERWVDAILYANKMKRHELPTDVWLRPRWRRGEDPADVAMFLQQQRDTRRSPKSGPQTIESFRGALEREFGRPSSDMRYVRGVGLRWEVLPESGVMVDVTIKRDPSGKVFASVRSMDGRPEASFDVDGAAKLVKEHLGGNRRRAELSLMSKELNIASRKHVNDSPEEFAKVLQRIFAKYSFHADVKPGTESPSDRFATVYVTVGGKLSWLHRYEVGGSNFYWSHDYNDQIGPFFAFGESRN